MKVMLVLSFLGWWYGRGWKEVWQSFGSRFGAVADTFSISQLLRTLFDPWRRIITYPGASLGDRLRAWADNAFSRVIGFVVRLLVLFAALLAVIMVIILTSAEAIIWPLLPAAVPFCLVAGVLA